jgi:hypothetical protein
MNMRQGWIAAAMAAVTAGAAAAQTLDWTNAGGDRRWNNPLNWNPQAVPAITNAVTIGEAATPEASVLLADEPGACGNLTLNSANGSCLDVATNLTIGTLLLANDKQGRFRQTAGAVTVTGALNMAYANFGKGLLSVSGENSVFHDLGTISAARYYGAEATIRLENGATAIFEKNLTLNGQDHATSPSVIDAIVRDGGRLQAVADFSLGGGRPSITVSNATVEVGGSWWMNQAALATIQSNAAVVVKALNMGQYRDCNALWIQEPGSEVVVRDGLRITGAGQGGGNWATNNVYEMRGGLLIVTNGMNVANNGHGIFRQSGGVVEVRTGNIQLQTQTSTGSDLVLPVSSLELSQDAVFRHLGGTFYLGGDPYNPAPGKVVIRGTTPTMVVQALRFRASGVFSPLVGPDGVAPLTVAGNATFDAGCAVLPEALPGAVPGEQTILTWGGTGTTPQNLTLHADADHARWKLVVDPAGKRVLLRYRDPGTAFLVR